MCSRRATTLGCLRSIWQAREVSTLAHNTFTRIENGDNVDYWMYDELMEVVREFTSNQENKAQEVNEDRLATEEDQYEDCDDNGVVKAPE